jgi:hypothetical protein
MRVTLGTFARSSIESQLGSDLAETVETAVYHYTRKVKAGRPPVPLPQFLGTGPSPDFGTSTSTSNSRGREELELTLDSETEAVLRREAIRYGTDIDAVTTHSVMIYLAELDFLWADAQSV